jgi:hypothetical protein
MGGDIVGGCIPSLLKEEKTKFFSQAKVPTTQGLKLCSGSSGSLGEGVWRECLFQLAHIVLLFMPQLVIGIPQNQRGTCILPTTQASYYLLGFGEHVSL